MSLVGCVSTEPGRKAPYSCDLRWRVVWLRISQDLTFREIGQRLCIAPSTAHAVFTRFEETGEVEPLKQPLKEDQQKLDSHNELLLIALVLETPTSYLHELCGMLYEATGVCVSETTICRVLKCHGLTRRKVRLVAQQRSLARRAEFMARVLFFPQEQLVFVDETGSDARSIAKKFSYSLRGMRAEVPSLLVRGQRVSTMAAIDHNGLIHVKLTTRTVNANTFYDFIRGDLLSNLQPFDGTNERSVVIMDNCSIHHVDSITSLFEEAGVLLLFLPPYSPDYMAIEEAFSYIKAYLRLHSDIFQVTRDPIALIRAAFTSITSDQCNAVL